MYRGHQNHVVDLDQKPAPFAFGIAPLSLETCRLAPRLSALACLDAVDVAAPRPSQHRLMEARLRRGAARGVQGSARRRNGARRPAGDSVDLLDLLDLEVDSEKTIGERRS